MGIAAKEKKRTHNPQCAGVASQWASFIGYTYTYSTTAFLNGRNHGLVAKVVKVGFIVLFQFCLWLLTSSSVVGRDKPFNLIFMFLVFPESLSLCVLIAHSYPVIHGTNAWLDCNFILLLSTASFI